MILFWALAGLAYFLFNAIVTLLMWSDLDYAGQKVLYLLFGLPIALLAIPAIIIYVIVKDTKKGKQNGRDI